MKLLAMRNPNRRRLIDLIMLFIRSVAHWRQYSESMQELHSGEIGGTSFLESSSFERMAEFFHLRRCRPDRHGCL